MVRILQAQSGADIRRQIQHPEEVMIQSGWRAYENFQDGWEGHPYHVIAPSNLHESQLDDMQQWCKDQKLSTHPTLIENMFSFAAEEDRSSFLLQWGGTQRD